MKKIFLLTLLFILVSGNFIVFSQHKKDTTQVKKLKNNSVRLKLLASQSITHIVRRGETFIDIEDKYHVLKSDIRTWNNLKNNRLLVGQRLKIYKPQKAIYTVQSGETLESIAKDYGLSKKQIEIWNEIELDSTIKAGTELVLFLPTAPDKSELNKEVRHNSTALFPVTTINSNPFNTTTTTNNTGGFADLNVPRPINSNTTIDPFANLNNNRTPNPFGNANSLPYTNPTPSPFGDNPSSSLRQKFYKGQKEDIVVEKVLAVKSSNTNFKEKYWAIFPDLKEGHIILVKNTSNNKIMYIKTKSSKQKRETDQELKVELSTTCFEFLGVEKDNSSIEVSYYLEE